MKRRTYITGIAMALTLSACATAPRVESCSQPAGTEPSTAWIKSLETSRPVMIDSIKGDGRDALIIIIADE